MKLTCAGAHAVTAPADLARENPDSPEWLATAKRPGIGTTEAGNSVLR